MEPDQLRSPSRTRSLSPTRQMEILPEIPEARPGPNAFAQQAQRLERHRLEGNAFYQQELLRRRAAPPRSVHPALRDEEPHYHLDVQDPRNSASTSLSPFVTAGRRHSPPLKLIPGEESYPTRRGIIEEGCERMVHEASGKEEDRTPVYQTIVPTPKPPSSEFVGIAKPPTPRKPRISLPKQDSYTGSNEPMIKSPTKRTFFDKLRMTKGSGTQSSSVSTRAVNESSRSVAKMPVKAQAVLGASQSTTHLARTPSKQKKGIFTGRKVEEQTKADSAAATRTTKSEDWPPSASTQGYTKTPKTGISDPTHYSFDSMNYGMKHGMHGTIPDQGLQHGHGTLQRTQSLKYIDSVAPPTPPAKNTPPDQKLYGAAAASLSCRPLLHQPNSTPSTAPEGVISTSERLSPTKCGSYGLRETPTLVTRPSMYSLHASVVPEVMQYDEFELMKSRIDGLDLEGFSMPAETHHRVPEMVYSPSIYSVKWSGTPNTVCTTNRGNRLSLGALSSAIEIEDNNGFQIDHKASSSASSDRSKQTIDVYYPELASDPCFQNHTSQAVLFTSAGEDVLAGDQKRTRYTQLDASLHSGAHSGSQNQKLQSTRTSPSTQQLDEPFNASPESFSHKSAVPSPLHFLPATFYTPAPKGVHRMTEIGATDNTITSEPAASTKRSDSTSPSRQNGIFENVPILQASQQKDCTRPSAAPHSKNASDQVNLDPLKPDLAYVSGSDKQNQIVQLLNSLLLSRNTNDHYIEDLLKTVIARNTDIASMREEVRANNARLDARLAAMESLQKLHQHSWSSRLSSPDSEREVIELGGDGGQDGRSLMISSQAGARILTETAHEFYRRFAHQPSPPTSEDEGVVSGLSLQVQPGDVGKARDQRASLPSMSVGEDTTENTNSFSLEAQKLARLEETMQALTAEIQEMKNRHYEEGKLTRLEGTMGVFAAETREMKRKIDAEME